MNKPAKLDQKMSNQPAVTPLNTKNNDYHWSPIDPKAHWSLKLLVTFGLIAGVLSSLSTIIQYYNSRHTASAPTATEKHTVDVPGKWNETEAETLVLSLVQQQQHRKTVDFCDATPCKITNRIYKHYDLQYKDKEAQVIAVESSDGSDCHGCAPKLSFFEFQKQEAGWKLTESDFAVMRWGQWGKTDGEINAMVIGDNIYGIAFVGGGTHHGTLVASTSIYARVGDTFREIFNEQTSESGDGEYTVDKKPYDWSSKIKIMPGTVGFYDLIVERTGRVGKFGSDSGRANQHDDKKSTRFKFDGQKYVRSELYQ